MALGNRNWFGSVPSFEQHIIKSITKEIMKDDSQIVISIS